ncbi:MAG: ATP-binding protein, partial [Bdellovibrionota bacterium]|nr:ATP-binding protein [Bdellovibrionota bacterium]
KTIISIPSIKNEENILNEMFDKLLYLPIKFSLFRYQKVIKEISENLGKKIKFSLVGEECSLDRDSLNILQEAIVHLIRNAVDHGIEKPNDRLIKGKNEVGLIEILCQQLDDDNISITIKDDGVGIDVNKLTEKGVKLGLVEKDKVEVMSTKEKINLIFIPSVSTKENVTEISGRGIGMDVVKKSLNLLGADLNIETTMNEGTSFCLTFSSNAKVKQL